MAWIGATPEFLPILVHDLFSLVRILLVLFLCGLGLLVVLVFLGFLAVALCCWRQAGSNVGVWERCLLVRRLCHLLSIWGPQLAFQYLCFDRGALCKFERSVHAIDRSGPVFIKLAQWLSTRRDLLPEELCDAMSTLHEQVTSTDSPRDRSLAQKATKGLSLLRLLGGGCIAQVYLGELQDPGSLSTTLVAVKVRRLGVPEMLRLDLALLRWAARWALWAWGEQLEWLCLEEALDDFGRYLVEQIDLRVEARNLTKLRELSQHANSKVSVPCVHVVTEDVMVTDFAQGVSLSDFIAREKRNDLRKAAFNLILDTFARMLLVDGFVHADMHPGNIFVNVVESSSGMKCCQGVLSLGAAKGNTRASPLVPQITLIDAGICMEVPERLRRFAVTSLKCALRMDTQGLGEAVKRLHKEGGRCTHACDLPGMVERVGVLLVAGCFTVGKEIWSQLFPTLEAYLSCHASDYFLRTAALLSEHRVRVDPQLWSLLTSVALMEGSAKSLGYSVNVLRAATPYLFSPRDLVERLRSSIAFNRSEQGTKAGKAHGAN